MSKRKKPRKHIQAKFSHGSWLQWHDPDTDKIRRVQIHYYDSKFGYYKIHYFENNQRHITYAAEANLFKTKS